MILSATAMQAQAQFSIRAASAQPVEGWERMQVEHCQSRCAVWVAPAAAITAGDIEKAQPQVRADGDTVIAVTLTDAGAEKLRDFTRGQFNKPMAMVIDGRVIWAPLVRGEFSKETGLTGSGPNGLTQEEVKEIISALALTGQTIPFEICAESRTWTRPSPEVQAKIWNMGIYDGFGRAAYEWTHNFIVLDDPLSASGDYHLRNLSGLWTEPPPVNKCDQNNRRNGNEWIEVSLLLHRVTQVTHTGNSYTITVEPSGKGFQFVYIHRLNPSAVLRFVTPDGKELEVWDEFAPPNKVKK
jgi:hypothetical protein